MKPPGYKALKELVKKRELTFGEFWNLLPKKFNDHRDCITFATLYKSDYIETSVQIETPDNKGVLGLALFFHTANLGKGNSEYQGIKTYNSEDFSKTEKVLCTAKTDLYFAEKTAKRNERLITLGIGILIAVVSSVCASYLTYFITSN